MGRFLSHIDTHFYQGIERHVIAKGVIAEQGDTSTEKKKRNKEQI